ncbi:MAG: hypothetical protein DRH08_03130 [Deltaproteobacteria bacterium]|nr:MAG: hypothetical protein DRH08_03130 [Deltaproteobacteria bacterium]
MKRSDIKKKIAEEIQSGLRGFISNTLAKAKNLPDGSIQIGKAQVERWKKVLEATHYKSPTPEKTWSSAIADRIIHVMTSLKKKETKTPADPRVAELQKAFIEYCENIQGFKPVLNYARDTVMIKRTLVNYSKEDVLDCFDWFLNDKSSKELSASISTALAPGVFNKFLSQR